MTESTADKYTVLARKYRPQTFTDLVGQDVLVRTLTNAIEQDRLAHAYLLTGIRGVGKTSTARIIAKALCCIGKDGKGNATPQPCGECEHCKSISESRHVDVLEMDAASRTGVGDIREIIDNVSYLPVSSRYKIYIIDEVHMLSKSAFNALLKTLEEPPPHVKFIFATTEVRKIPITILSRCQRFDLPRVDNALLIDHLGSVAKKENVTIEDTTLAMIANVAEGSVRDALSLLDQAIAHSGSDRNVEVQIVQDMLGLLGKEKLFSMFDAIAAGNAAEAIAQLRKIYSAGAEPLVVLQDLLELSHVITQYKIVPDLAEDIHLSEADRKQLKVLAEKLSIPYLTRVWQMTLKGISETHIASNPLMAAEMILIRLSYAANLPSPGDLVKELKGDKTTSAPPPAVPVNPVPADAPIQFSNPSNFMELVELFKQKNELFLYNWLRNEVHPVSFEEGKVEIRLTSAAPKELPNRLSEHLREWTGKRWIVLVSNEEGEKTLNQMELSALEKQKSEAAKDPSVLEILELFPEATITSIEPIKVPHDENVKKEKKLKKVKGETV